MRRALLIFGAMILSALPARAHDPRKPELDNWYTSLITDGGNSCCSHEDCKVLSYGPDERSESWIDLKRGVWQVRITPRVFPGGRNQVVDAPPEIYAKQVVGNAKRVAPNLTEGVVACWHQWLGLRCFIPPPEF